MFEAGADASHVAIAALNLGSQQEARHGAGEGCGGLIAVDVSLQTHFTSIQSHVRIDTAGLDSGR